MFYFFISALFPKNWKIVEGKSFSSIFLPMPAGHTNNWNLEQYSLFLPGHLETSGEHIFNTNKGSREEDEVSGFFVLSHLWLRGYFRLG